MSSFTAVIERRTTVAGLIPSTEEPPNDHANPQVKSKRWVLARHTFTVDGLIWAASMVILDAGRRKQPVPPLAKRSLGVGIVATIGANVAHGLDHGTIGALVSAWPALALVGSFELLMLLTRNATQPEPTTQPERLTPGSQDEACTKPAHAVEQAILADYVASLNGPGRPISQRFLAEKHGIDRRKVKRIISATAQPE